MPPRVPRCAAGAVYPAGLRGIERGSADDGYRETHCVIRGRPRIVLAHTPAPPPRGTIDGQAFRAATCRRSETAPKADNTALGTSTRVHPGRDLPPTCPPLSTPSPVGRQPWDAEAWRRPRLRREVLAEPSGLSAQVRSDATATPLLEARPPKAVKDTPVPTTIRVGARPPSFLLI